MNRDQLKKELEKRNPALKASLELNRPKREHALALRAARKKAGLTTDDIFRTCGISKGEIERMDAPSGALPSEALTELYLSACKGKSKSY